MGARKWVFAVHSYETGDGKHHVSYGKGSKYKTRRFSKWSIAKKFANEQAKKMKMKQYQIDTPAHPHTMVTTTMKKRATTTKRRKTRKRSNLFSLF